MEDFPEAQRERSVQNQRGTASRCSEGFGEGFWGGGSDTLVSRYRRRGEVGDVFTAGCSQGSFQQVSSSVSHNTLALLPPGFFTLW